MADTPKADIWTGRVVFLALALGLMFLRLLPLDTLPPRWVGPDLLLGVALVWAARRPDFLPILLIAAVFLLADLLFQRPPGLWTALVLILTEALRARARTLRGGTLSTEWLTVAVGIVVITLANRFILALMVAPLPPFGLSMMEMALTILVYPLLAGLAAVLFGVRRPAPGAVDKLGHRL